MTDSNPLDAMTKSLSPTAAAVWEAFEHANCDPTPLSPAAQAVWNAANNSSAYGPEDCLNEARQIAAAALRAAANQFSYAGADEAAAWLTEIAAELDGGAQ